MVIVVFGGICVSSGKVSFSLRVCGLRKLCGRDVVSRVSSDTDVCQSMPFHDVPNQCAKIKGLDMYTIDRNVFCYIRYKRL